MLPDDRELLTLYLMIFLNLVQSSSQKCAVIYPNS